MDTLSLSPFSLIFWLRAIDSSNVDRLFRCCCLFFFVWFQIGTKLEPSILNVWSLYNLNHKIVIYTFIGNVSLLHWTDSEFKGKVWGENKQTYKKRSISFQKFDYNLFEFSSKVRYIYIYTILWTTSRIDNTFSNLFMWNLREEMHGNIEKKVDFCFSMCKVQNRSPFSHRWRSFWLWFIPFIRSFVHALVRSFI